MHRQLKRIHFIFCDSYVTKAVFIAYKLALFSALNRNGQRQQQSITIQSYMCSLTYIHMAESYMESAPIHIFACYIWISSTTITHSKGYMHVKVHSSITFIVIVFNTVYGVCMCTTFRTCVCIYASWLHTENQKSRLTFAKQTDRYTQRDMHAYIHVCIYIQHKIQSNQIFYGLVFCCWKMA